MIGWAIAKALIAAAAFVAAALTPISDAPIRPFVAIEVLAVAICALIVLMSTLIEKILAMFTFTYPLLARVFACVAAAFCTCAPLSRYSDFVFASYMICVPNKDIVMFANNRIKADEV